MTGAQPARGAYPRKRQACANSRWYTPSHPPVGPHCLSEGRHTCQHPCRTDTCIIRNWPSLYFGGAPHVPAPRLNRYVHEDLGTLYLRHLRHMVHIFQKRQLLQFTGLIYRMAHRGRRVGRWLAVHLESHMNIEVTSPKAHCTDVVIT